MIKVIDEAHAALHAFRQINYHDPDYVIIPLDKCRILRDEVNSQSAIGYEDGYKMVKLFGIKIIETTSVEEIIFCYDKRH